MTVRHRLIGCILYLCCLSCNQVGEVPDPGLVYIWSGAPTTDGITISFKSAGEQKSRVIIHKDPNLQDTVLISDEIETTIKDYFTGKAVFKGLESGSKYFYSLAWPNQVRELKGSFQTLPQGPASFKIAFGSCARTGSNHSLFSTINRLDPLFFMNMGDFHYANIRQNCAYSFAEAYFDNLRSRTQAALYSSRPFVYIWDDHDYGPNNAAADADCRKEALEAYRRFIPHYPLAFEDDDEPISQSFNVGRIRFILTDLRSEKIRPEYEGCERTEAGSNFGTEDHLEWFLEQLLAARANGELVAWVNPIPWIADERSPKYDCDEKDDWSGFPEERTVIADFIKKQNIPLFILSGDAHMVAIDDGTNSDYASGGGAPIPVFHAAPLDNVGIYKGGPYSHGFSRKRGQFGIMEVEDNGGTEICITFKGMSHNGRLATNINGQALVYRFCKRIN